MKFYSVMKQFVNGKVFSVITLIILLISFLSITCFVGYDNGLDSLYMLLFNAVVLCFSMLYFVLKKIFVNDFKVLTNKLDVFALILCLTPIIPILFNSCIGLSDAVITLFKYIVLFNIYLLVREIISTKEKFIYIFSYCFVGIGLILCIVGFDDLFSQVITSWISDAFHLLPVSNNLERMRSIILYPNVFAIFIDACIIIITSLFINKSSIKLRLIYTPIIFIFLVSLLISKSIGAIIVLGIIVLLQLIFSSKENKYILLEMYLLNGVFALVFAQLFNGMISFIECMGYIVLFSVVLIFLQYILIKIINPKLYNASLKNVLIIICSIIFFIIVFIAVGLSMTTQINILNKDSSSSKYLYPVRMCEPDEEYTFIFDIESNTEFDNNYTIIAEERSKDDIVINQYEVMVFDNFNGKKEFNIHTRPETKYFQFVFLAKKLDNDSNAGITVKSITANNENLVLDYVYLPLSLVNKVFYILNEGFEYKTISYRFEFMSDAIKIIKDNWLTGIGGASWQYEYHHVQDFKYYTTQVHNYYLQMFAECGIIAFLLIILLIYAVIEFYIKNRKELSYTYIMLLLCVLAFGIHALFDMTMGYYFIMAYTFAILGILSAKIGKKINNKFDIVFLIVLLVINAYVCSTQIVKAGVINSYMDKNAKVSISSIDFLLYDDLSKQIYLQKYEIDKKYDIAYYNSFKKNCMLLNNNEKYFLSSNYIVKLIELTMSYSGKITAQERYENIKYVYDYIDYHIRDYNYDVNTQINKFSCLYEVVNVLNKYSYLFNEDEKMIFNDFIELFKNNCDDLIDDIQYNDLLVLEQEKKTYFLKAMKQLKMKFEKI